MFYSSGARFTRKIKAGKEVYWYSAILSSISKRSDMDYTVLPPS